MIHRASCYNCYIGLDEDPSAKGENRPCPNCGSTRRDYYLETADGAIEFMGQERPPTLIGRTAELHKLNLLIAQRRKAISITGLAGVGKTALVRQFLFGQENFATEWLNADSNLSVGEQIDNFLLRIRLSEERREYIVVMDGVDRLTHYEIREYLGKLTNYKAVITVIFTSRKPIVEVGGITEFTLDPLSQRDFLDWSEVKKGIIYDLDEQLEIPPGQIIKVVKPEIIVIKNALIEKLKSSPEDLYTITPRQFEQVVADLLSDMGWEVELTPETRDGGKDILAYRDTGLGKFLCLVEAKRYNKTRPIRVELIRQLYGTLNHHKANMAMLVTTSRFTKDSKEFQKHYEYLLSLKDYTDVISWLANYKGYDQTTLH